MLLGFICQILQLPGLQITLVALLQFVFFLLNFSSGALDLQAKKHTQTSLGLAPFVLLGSFLSVSLLGVKKG